LLSGAGNVDPMRGPLLSKYCVLLVCLSFMANAADRIFSGSLERVTHTSITIRLADGLIVDAVLPAAFAVPYHLADQVEIACTPVKTTYDAPAGLHYHLRLKSLRLLRPTSPQEQAAMIESLSWQPGENLLQPGRFPAPTVEASQLNRVSEVNLDYVAKLPDFVADETNLRYRSYDLGKPWSLEHTVQDEVTVKDHSVFHRNVHKHASTLSGALDKPMNFDFGLHLEAVLGPQCASQVEFVGREEVDGQPMLVYFFHISPGACFGVVHNGNRQFAAITGRILVDATNLHALRSEWVGTGFPEKFAVDRFATTELWRYATIGGSSYLVPVSSEVVLRMSDGSAERAKTEYKNHRHFETATTITFGKDQ
jgi:hypothetical protein